MKLRNAIGIFAFCQFYIGLWRCLINVSLLKITLPKLLHQEFQIWVSRTTAISKHLLSAHQETVGSSPFIVSVLKSRGSFPGRPYSIHAKCKYKVNAKRSWLPPENPSNEWHKSLPHCYWQTGAEEQSRPWSIPKEPVPVSPWLCGVKARWFHCQRSHRVGT